MLPLILFHTLRGMAVIFFVLNLALISPNGLWGAVAVIFTLIACLNLYAWGLFRRETNNPLPGVFILVRILQGIVVLLFDALPLAQYGAFILMDAIFFGLLLYDSRYTFIYREPKEASTKIRRVNNINSK